MSNIPSLAPMRQLDRPRPTVEVERRADGTLLLSAGRDLPQDRPLIIDRLQEAAARRPNVTFLAQRRGPRRQWQHLTYAEAWARTGAVASWLIAQGYGPQSPPAAILSANSLEQALFLFGAQRAGLVVASLSPPYSLSGDLARLDYALDFVQPALVFAQESAAYGAALDRAALHGARIVTADGKRGLAFGALANTSVDAAVAERRLHITADTPAKILFTSGSAGPPKAVLNTHGNLAAAIEMMRAVSEPVDGNHVPVMLDWLPWHHTAGGNTSLNSIVRLAGTLYIDDGRPMPGRFQETIDNLGELSPSYFGSVPAAFPPLIETLERDGAFRHKFFKNLRSLGYGGALLPQENFNRLQAMAAAQLGERLPFGSGWGMTETTGTGFIVYWNVDRAGLLGLPLPGVTAKLVPVEDRYELRVKGPNVMASYYRNPEATQAAFDDEGFLRTGDAARWIDPTRPAAGLAFAGRITEEFKLASGTWVRSTTLRDELLGALQPYVRELVIAAPDRPWLGALVWLNPTVCAGAGWREDLLAGLRAYNAQAGGSSARILRLLPLVELPSLAAGEITDKDTINARRVLERRAPDVERLYAEPADPEVIVAG